MSKIFLIVFCIVIFLVSCSSKNEKIISLSDMKVIIWDMMCAENYYSYMTVSDTTFLQKKKNLQLYNQVFHFHDVSKEQFYNSYTYYEKHPDDMKVLFDSIEAFGSRVKFEFENKSIPKKNTKK